MVSKREGRHDSSKERESMGNHIVCGIDPSPGADRAAAVTAALARELECEAMLVHVLQVPGLSGHPGLHSIGQARELRKLHALVEEHVFPRDTRIELRDGDAAEELVRVAEELDAELIVVGSRGLLEIGSVLLGSVSSALMRAAPCPVVAVAPGAALPFAPAGIHAVVCGVGGSERDGPLLRLSADLGRRLRATLHAVHAFDPRPVPAGRSGLARPLLPELHQAAEATLARSLAEAGVQAQGHAISLPPAPALQRVAEHQGAGLIVVASQGQGKLHSILHGSVTIQLAAEAPVPVVVLPPGAELGAGSGHYEVDSHAA
jgi:nucleotide-binding universal stress UspA family protein